MKTSSRCFDEDEYILINHTSSEDVSVMTNIFVLCIRLPDVFKTIFKTSCYNVFKTFSRRLGQDQYIRLVHTSSRRLQDVFKTSGYNILKTFSRRFQDFLKMSRKYVLKTSSRRFEDGSSS